MLASLSTILARSKRHQRIVPLCYPSTPEIMLACLEAANKKQVETVIVLDEEKLGFMPLNLAVDFCIGLAKQSKTAVSIAVSCKPTEEAIRSTLSLKVPSIILKESDHSRKYLTKFTSWAVKLARCHHAEIIGTLKGLATANRLEQYLHETGVTAISLPIGVIREGKPYISIPYIEQIAKIAKIPLLAQEFSISASALGKYASAGLVGISISSELDQAYTAGLRTSLRNRDVIEPKQYQDLAIKSVIHTLNNYFERF